MYHYQIVKLLKFWEEDKFEEGCLPDTGGSLLVDVDFSAPTPDAVIKKAVEYLGIKDDAVEKNAGDQDGRVDFSVLEDEYSNPASPAQIKKWKAGEYKLYSAIYTGHVEKVEPVKL